MTPAASTVRGPLRPVELATAAVMAAVTVVLAVAGVVIPVAGILQVLAVVPMGVVAQRHRPRALVAATAAATTVGFLIAGTAPITTIALAGLLGGIVGEVKRRGRVRSAQRPRSPSPPPRWACWWWACWGSSPRCASSPCKRSVTRCGG